jgi:putative transposase
MLSVARYAKNAGAVFSLRYHLVWCPKYRRSVLCGGVDDRLREVIAEVSREIEAEVLALEVMPDHVHLFLAADPRWGVAALMRRFKGTSSRVLRAEFPHLRSRLPTLWSRSYYAGTVGHVSEATIRRYIAGQKGV